MDDQAEQAPAEQAPAGMSAPTIEEARASLARHEARSIELNRLLAAEQDRMNKLRQYVAALLVGQAQALLDQVDERQRKSRQLTEKEIEWARLYATMPLSVDELAKRRHVSVNTAKTHIKNIYRKLGVGSRFELWEAVRQAEIVVEDATLHGPDQHLVADIMQDVKAIMDAG